MSGQPSGRPSARDRDKLRPKDHIGREPARIRLDDTTKRPAPAASNAEPTGNTKPGNSQARSQPLPSGVGKATKVATTSTNSPKRSPRKGKKKGHSALEMGIKNMEVVDDDYLIQTVEILKRPGQTLGFYIREGNGMDRQEGVFISRIAAASVVENNGLLRVGDEILTVNSVDVTHTSLDDVVILMSIPKRLVLSIRTRRSCSKNASCPSLSTLEVEETPIVVLKKGHCGSTTALGITDKCPDDYVAGRQDGSYYGKHTTSGYGSPHGDPSRKGGGSKSRPAPPPPYKTQQGGGDRQIPGDDSGDSGLSSENSGYSRAGEGSSQSSSQQPPVAAAYPPNVLERAVDDLDSIPMDSTHFQEVLKEGHRSPRLSPREPGHHGMGMGGMSMVGYRSPRVGRRANTAKEDIHYVPLDYSSDSGESRHFVPHHQRSSSVSDSHGGGRYQMGGRYYDMNSVKAFQDEIERTHGRYEPGYYTTRHKLTKARSISPECYNSDSEVVYSKMRDRTPGREAVISRIGDGEDRCNSLPHVDATESAEEIKHWLRKFDNLSYELQGQEDMTAAPMSGSYTGGSPARDSNHVDQGKEPSMSADEQYWSWYSSKVNPAVLPKDCARPGRPGQPRVTRKHSADSLIDYRTYQLDDPLGDALAQDQRFNPSQTLGRGSKNSLSYTSLNSLTTNTLTASKSRSSDPDGKNVPPPASRIRDLQLARKPLAIRVEDFRCYKPDQEHKKVPFPDRLLDGLLCVHVLCGHGLKSSRTMLRDLYCVIQVDSINKARTMIRTGAINFDWDEAFELDLRNAHELQFLVYSWDPNTRHRLCFNGNLVLQAFIQYGSRQRIALKLEPKGVLYLDINYKEPAVTLQRIPSIRKNALFGVDLETVVKREKGGGNVPIIVKRCVEEVERRGLDHVGIYRLCGSARRKTQLRDEFEKSVRNTDLSQDNISDINVITGVLKDFLRELPEPLFTNALYQMLLDALSVRLPGDPHGSATLMLSILDCLPKANQETLMYLLDHLKRIALKSEANKMNAHNLAVCFGPVLLCPSPQSVTDVEMNFKKHIDVLHYLLDIWPENRGGSSSGSQVSGGGSGGSLLRTCLEGQARRQLTCRAEPVSDAGPALYQPCQCIQCLSDNSTKDIPENFEDAVEEPIDEEYHKQLTMCNKLDISPDLQEKIRIAQSFLEKRKRLIKDNASICSDSNWGSEFGDNIPGHEKDLEKPREHPFYMDNSDFYRGNSGEVRNTLVGAANTKAYIHTNASPSPGRWDHSRAPDVQQYMSIGSLMDLPVRGRPIARQSNRTESMHDFPESYIPSEEQVLPFEYGPSRTLKQSDIAYTLVVDTTKIASCKQELEYHNVPHSYIYPKQFDEHTLRSKQEEYYPNGIDMDMQYEPYRDNSITRKNKIRPRSRSLGRRKDARPSEHAYDDDPMERRAIDDYDCEYYHSRSDDEGHRRSQSQQQDCYDIRERIYVDRLNQEYYTKPPYYEDSIDQQYTRRWKDRSKRGERTEHTFQREIEKWEMERNRDHVYDSLIIDKEGARHVSKDSYRYDYNDHNHASHYQDLRNWSKSREQLPEVYVDVNESESRGRRKERPRTVRKHPIITGDNDVGFHSLVGKHQSRDCYVDSHDCYGEGWSRLDDGSDDRSSNSLDRKQRRYEMSPHGDRGGGGSNESTSSVERRKRGRSSGRNRSSNGVSHDVEEHNASLERVPRTRDKSYEREYQQHYDRDETIAVGNEYLDGRYDNSKKSCDVELTQSRVDRSRSRERRHRNKGHDRERSSSGRQHDSSASNRIERSPSGRRGDRSPSGRTGDRSPSSRRSNRSPSGRRGNRSPSGRRGNRSPSGRRGDRSPSGRRYARSPSGRRGDGSPSRRRNDRSPSGRRGQRSPSGRREDDIPDANMDGRARKDRSRSRGRRRSPQNRSSSNHREMADDRSQNRNSSKSHENLQDTNSLDRQRLSAKTDDSQNRTYDDVDEINGTEIERDSKKYTIAPDSPKKVVTISDAPDRVQYHEQAERKRVVGSSRKEQIDALNVSERHGEVKRYASSPQLRRHQDTVQEASRMRSASESHNCEYVEQAQNLRYTSYNSPKSKKKVPMFEADGEVEIANTLDRKGILKHGTTDDSYTESKDIDNTDSATLAQDGDNGEVRRGGRSPVPRRRNKAALNSRSKSMQGGFSSDGKSRLSETHNKEATETEVQETMCDTLV